MADLLSAATPTTNKIYRHSGFTTTIRSSISLSTRQGVSWDSNNNLLTGENGGGNKFYRHSGFTTTVLTSYAHTAGIRGIAFDGTDHWTCSDTGNKVWRRSGFTSTVKASWALTDPMGLGWDGTNIYATTFTKAIKYSGKTSTVNSSFSYSWTTPDVRGCAVDSSNNFYTSDTDDDKIRKHSGFSNTINSSIAAPVADTADIAFDAVNGGGGGGAFQGEGIWNHKTTPAPFYGGFDVRGY